MRGDTGYWKRQFRKLYNLETDIRVAISPVRQFTRLAVAICSDIEKVTNDGNDFRADFKQNLKLVPVSGLKASLFGGFETGLRWDSH